MDKRVMREIRRMVIERHMWIRGNVANLTLCVRLYERQFHGLEMNLYK